MMQTTVSLSSRRTVFRYGLGAVAVAALPSMSASAQVREYVVEAPDEAALLRGLASGAGHVILPEGQIVLTATLRLPAGVSLSGAGVDRTVLAAGERLGPAAAMIEADGGNAALSGFALDGRARNGRGTGHGFQLRGSGYRLQDLQVSNVAQAGYRLAVSGTEVLNCAALDCGRAGHTDNHGFMLYATAQDSPGGVRDVVFRDCVVRDAYRKGFALFTDGPAVSGVTYETCVATGCGLPGSSGGGFYLVPARGRRMGQVTVRDCRAEDNYVNYEIGPVTDLTVRGCQSRGARATGFLFHGNRRFEILENSDEGAGVDAMRFDEVLGTSVGGRVADNTLFNANRSARGFASYINLEGVEDAEVTGNRFGDRDGQRTPFGIYEGARRDRNRVQENHPLRPE